MNKLFKKFLLLSSLTFLLATPVMAETISSTEISSSVSIKLTDDVVLTDMEGNTYPVYEVINLDSNASLNVDTDLLAGDIYENFSWSIKANKQQETDTFYLYKGDKLYINDVVWNKNSPIHLGITNGSKNYYSDLSSGSFNGYLTAKESSSFSFYIKNVGYDTISANGFITGYPW